MTVLVEQTEKQPQEKNVALNNLQLQATEAEADLILKSNQVKKLQGEIDATVQQNKEYVNDLKNKDTTIEQLTTQAEHHSDRAKLLQDKIAGDEINMGAAFEALYSDLQAALKEVNHLKGELNAQQTKLLIENEQKEENAKKLEELRKENTLLATSLKEAKERPPLPQPTPPTTTTTATTPRNQKDHQHEAAWKARVKALEEENQTLKDHKDFLKAKCVELARNQVHATQTPRLQPGPTKEELAAKDRRIQDQATELLLLQEKLQQERQNWAKEKAYIQSEQYVKILAQNGQTGPR
eukprot:TRINITY_DN53564_c0_g2_i1.p1 TRINITY_DN53564_c0_g2~~TRINITY_DN53564_c0_g2_i1.p1  ORF type:complete len:303 (+),score=76.54 TRINITY_DN53564_c0_g2_i1:22-909(+)